MFHVEQALNRDGSVVVSALGTVGTVLGAASRLDTEQCAQLYLLGVVEAPVNLLGPKELVGQGQIIDLSDLLVRPIVADQVVVRGFTWHGYRAHVSS